MSRPHTISAVDATPYGTRLLKAYRGMDIIFTLSKEQYETGRKLTIPEKN